MPAQRTITLDIDTGHWVSHTPITGDEGNRLAASLLPGISPEQIHEFYSRIMAEEPYCYSCDQNAVEWARAAVEKVRDWCRELETQGSDNSDNWRRLANLLEMKLIGGETCVVTPFDARLSLTHKYLHEVTE